MSIFLTLWKKYMLHIDFAKHTEVDKRCLGLEEGSVGAIGERLQLRDLAEWTKEQSAKWDKQCQKAAILLLENTPPWRSGKEYQYTSLPRGAPYFRYLLLEPAEDPKAELVCSLHVASLNDPPEFEAISYVWGSNLKTRHVICNGARLNITKNLCIALRQCRWTGRPRALWSDAICINQSDNIEKGSQVALMGRIYTESSGTLICLRPLFVDWPDLSKTINEAASLIRDIGAMKSAMEQDAASEAPGGLPAPGPESPLMTDKRWRSMWEIANTEWFGRCWTIQEAALGRQCTIILGNEQEGDRIDWVGFLKAWAWYRQRDGKKPKKVWYWRPLSRLHLDKILREESEVPPDAFIRQLSFLDQLHEVRNYRFRTSDDRDRVYSLIGLSSFQELGLSLQPDYSKHYLHVYQQLARSYLEQTSDLSILHYVENYNYDLNACKKRLLSSMFPYTASWYPRWHRPAPHTIFTSKTMNRRKRPAHPIPAEFKGDILITQGTIIDTITFASKHFEKLYGRERGISRMDEVRSLWKHVKKACHGQQSPYVSPLSVFVHCLLLEGRDFRQEGWFRHIRGYKHFLDPRCAETQPGQYEEKDVPTEPFGTKGDPKIIHRHVRIMAVRRRFALTSRGYFALVPIATREGDSICVMTATNTTFVLRRVKDCAEDTYQLAGSAFVPCRNIFRGPDARHTLGHDDQCEDWKDWGLREQNISIQ